VYLSCAPLRVFLKYTLLIKKKKSELQKEAFCLTHKYVEW